MLQSPGRRRGLLQLLALALGLVLSLLLAEGLLRLAGHRPWVSFGDRVDTPRVHEPDPLLGWRNRPGRYVGVFGRGSPPVVMNFLPDGTRSTGPRPQGARERLLLVGGSFTQGWAVADHETFAWRLQRRRPDLLVVNRGTGGYGTYQSLLVMEQALASPQPPDRILYGLIEDHENRNAAVAGWLRFLAAGLSAGAVAVPYCTLDERGELVRHPPLSYPEWPLRRRLATVTFAEAIYAEWSAARRTASKRAVTQALLREMQRAANAHRVRFGVVLLNLGVEARARYASFLEREGIETLDCSLPLTRALRVPGEGHPNGRAHARFASCIEAGLREDDRGRGSRG